MNVKIICILCVFLVSFTNALKYTGTYVPKIIQSHGYSIEIHEVITDDGYVVEMHRIPSGVKGETSQVGPRKVVILGHCIFCSSSVFVVLGPRKALAYMLADNGYDVWLMNSRGTRASRKHVSMSNSDSQYWKFSWNDQGYYDVAAIIDYTLKVSGERQVNYVAFSMANAQLFAMLSERPEYNEKIRTVIAIAPAVFMNTSVGFFPVQSPIIDKFLHVGLERGDLQFPPTDASADMITLLSGACNPVLKPILKSMCRFAFKLMGGNDNGNVDEDSLYYYFKFFPDTISLRTMVHYSQMRQTGRFEKYNFGRRMNKKIYGSSRPPSFDLRKVTVPVNVMFSYGDQVTNYKGIERFADNLPNLIELYSIPQKDFAHMDFIWGKSAPLMVYKKILERLQLDYSN